MSDHWQRSPDGRWWWDGERWRPILEPAGDTLPGRTPPGDAPPGRTPPGRTAVHPFTRALLVIAGILAILFLVGFAIGALLTGGNRTAQSRPPSAPARATAAPPPTSTPSPPHQSVDPVLAYLEVVSRDAQELTSAGSELGACGQDLARCRQALARLDEAARRFQADLDQNPAPTCLGAVDRELRSGLALYRQAAQQGTEAIDRRNLGQVLAALDAVKRGTDHLNRATTEAARARCS